MRFIEMQGIQRPARQGGRVPEVGRRQPGADHAGLPEGNRVGEIYAAVYSSDKDAGDFYWLDILDSYGALI